MLTKLQTLCFMLLCHSISSAVLSKRWHYYPYFVQVDIEAPRLRTSAQGHTPSGWDMNSDVFRNSLITNKQKNSLQDVPPGFAPCTLALGKEPKGTKKEKRQHPCYLDTNNLSGGRIWKIYRPGNKRQNVTAKEIY